LRSRHRFSAAWIHFALVAGVPQRTAAEKGLERAPTRIVATSARTRHRRWRPDHVIQIDALSSVSSFLQRMGRPPTRGSAANCTFSRPMTIGLAPRL
jgi:hypothetical protein